MYALNNGTLQVKKGNSRKTNRLAYKLLACINHFTSTVF